MQNVAKLLKHPALKLLGLTKALCGVTGDDCEWWTER
jgi:hypothetical protein